MARANKIGMGLDKLLSGIQLSSSAISPLAGVADTIRQLSIDSLTPNLYQPRTIFNQEELQSLADSIKQHGIVQPIVVRALTDQTNQQQNYEIIAGERRWRAAKIAGLAAVPAIIKKLSDKQARALALIENLQREDLTTWEIVQALDKLIKDFDLTHEKAAVLIGRSRSSVTNLLRLLELSKEVQELLQQQKLEMGHARALLALENHTAQQEIAKKVTQHHLTVRATEELVRRHLLGQQENSLAVEENIGVLAARDWAGNVSRVADLSKRLDIPMRIKLNKRKDAGKVIINFNSAAEFEDLIDKLVRLSRKYSK